MLNRLGVLGGALLLSACSLINSYDDVLPGSGGGGGSTSSSTTSTSSGGGEGGGTSTTTTSSGGGQGGGGAGEGGAGGEGGGVTELPQLSCSSPSKRLVQDTSTFTGLTPRFFESVRGVATGGGAMRIVAERRGSQLRDVQLLEVNSSGVPTSGPSTQVSAVLDVQRIGTDKIGALTWTLDSSTSPALGRVDLLVWGSGPIIDPPSVTTLFTYTNVSSASGRFVHVGPDDARIDFVLRTRESSGGHALRFHRHIPSAATTTLELGTNGDEAPLDPRALVLTGSGTNAQAHAFFGRGFNATFNTRRSSFLASSTSTPVPANFGAAGTTLGDARFFPFSSPVVGMAAIVTTPTSTADLYVGEVTPANLGSASLANLHLVHTFDDLADYPLGGHAQVQGRSAFLVGHVQSQKKLALYVAQTGLAAQDNGLRYQNPDLLPLDVPVANFTASSVVYAPATEQFAANGGDVVVLSAETDLAAATSEKLYQTRFTCTLVDP